VSGDGPAYRGNEIDFDQVGTPRGPAGAGVGAARRPYPSFSFGAVSDDQGLVL
jgi:hypothetical protein